MILVFKHNMWHLTLTAVVFREAGEDKIMYARKGLFRDKKFGYNFRTTLRENKLKGQPPESHLSLIPNLA